MTQLTSVEKDYDELCALFANYPTVMEQIDNLIIRLKRRQVSGSLDSSKQTAFLLRNILGNTKWPVASRMIHQIRLLGKVLTNANPLELAVGNVIRRTLYIIREEYVNSVKTMQLVPPRAEKMASQAQQALSLQSILEPSEITDFSVPMKDLKNSVMDVFSELMDEIENIHEHISDQALEHIHSNEVILTYGLSKSVEDFLIAAAKKRTFQVIVVESGPSLNGQCMARQLSLAGIETILVTDSAIFAMMARVNKVVISTHAVVANGGLIAQTGIHNVALAAKELSVPLVCITGLFKLSPLYPHDLDTLNDLISPGQILSYEDTSSTFMDSVNVVNPAYDYIPPELVDLFVTNIGDHQPSYVYRLLAEYYSPEDYELGTTSREQSLL